MKSILSPLFVLFATTVFAQDAGPNEEILCEDIETCAIPYIRLSNQETDPFLFHGRLMDNSHPRWSQYRSALRKFSDVRDCLIREEQEKAEPNLLLIDWAKVGTGRGAEVCIFRIFDSFEMPEQGQRWLEIHGFSISPLQRIGADPERLRYETQPWFNLGGNWTVELYWERNPNWLVDLTGIDITYTYGVTIMFAKNNSVVGVAIATPIE